MLAETFILAAVNSLHESEDPVLFGRQVRFLIYLAERGIESTTASCGRVAPIFPPLRQSLVDEGACGAPQ